MSKFKDAVDKILNSPMNRIKTQLLDYMSTSNYNTYAEIVFPVDWTSYIYEFNYRNLPELFQNNKGVFNLDDREIDKRNEALTNGMAYFHNYLSSQLSLLDILERHANQLPFERQLADEQKKFIDEKITKFLRELRNNIIHQTNFRPSLRLSRNGDTRKLFTQFPNC